MANLGRKAPYILRSKIYHTHFAPKGLDREVGGWVGKWVASFVDIEAREREARAFLSWLSYVGGGKASS